ncbi:MAG: hypothetical protein NTX72_01375 [Candidatus Uhrbacteria bacterium]|nr:hypothetical protein [Candidatus Uhrbacteria bacterium]
MADQEIPDPKIARVLGGHNHDVWQLALSPDQKLIAGAGNRGDPRVHIWNPETGEVVKILDGHQSDVHTVAWNKKGDRLITSDGASTLSWPRPDDPTQAWKSARVFSPQDTAIPSAAVSAKNLIASMYNNVIHVRNEANVDLGDQKCDCNMLVFNEDGTHLAASSVKNGIMVYDATDYEQALQRRLVRDARERKEEAQVNSLLWMGETLLTGCEDGSVRSVKDAPFLKLEQPVLCLTKVDDKTFAVGTTTGLVIAQFPEMVVQKQIGGFAGGISSVCVYGEENRYLIAASKERARAVRQDYEKWPRVLDFGGPNLGRKPTALIPDLPV